MANRACAADVVKMTGSTTADSVIDTFIGIANSLINLALANGCDVTDETVLLQAEALLGSHFLTTLGGGEEGGGKVVNKERFENYSVEYAVATIKGDGVNGTTYGQAANMLMDGCLSNLTAEKATVGFFGGVC